LEYCHTVWCVKTNGEKGLTIRLDIKTEYRHVTDRQMDGQTDILPQHSPCYAYASRVNKTIHSKVIISQYL